MLNLFLDWKSYLKMRERFSCKKYWKRLKRLNLQFLHCEKQKDKYFDCFLCCLMKLLILSRVLVFEKSMRFVLYLNRWNLGMSWFSSSFHHKSLSDNLLIQFLIKSGINIFLFQNNKQYYLNSSAQVLLQDTALLQIPILLPPLRQQKKKNH